MLYYFLHPYGRIKLKLNSGSETTLLQGLSVMMLIHSLLQNLVI